MFAIYPSAIGNNTMGDYNPQLSAGQPENDITPMQTPLEKACKLFEVVTERRHALCIGSKGAESLLKNRWKVTVGAMNKTAEHDLKIHVLSDEYSDCCIARIKKIASPTINRALDTIVLSDKTLKDKSFDLIHAEESLHVIPKDKFPDAWKTLKGALKSGGVYSGTFYISSQASQDDDSTNRTPSFSLFDRWVVDLLFQDQFVIKDSMETTKIIFDSGRELSVRARHIIAQKI